MKQNVSLGKDKTMMIGFFLGISSQKQEIKI